MLPSLPADLAVDPQYSGIFLHWNMLRGGRLLPDRSDLRLADALDIADKVMIFHFMSPMDQRYWFIGPAVSARMSSELSGQNFVDLLPPALARSVAEYYTALFAQPCGWWTQFVSELPDGSRPSLEVFSLPLTGMNGQVKFCMSVLADHVYARPPLTVSTAESFRGINEIHLRPIDIGAGVPWEGVAEVTLETA